MEDAANFLAWLRGRGHQVCLDDFDAGATAYNYLRHFAVDFVKIDGPFFKAATPGSRERVLLASIAKLCADLKSGTIAEMIETDGDAAAAIELGIGYGQGWLYGKPLAAMPPAKPATGSIGRRKGYSESWG